MSSEPVSRSSVAPTGSSASVTGRSSGAAAPCGPAGQAGSGAAGSQEYGQPGTTGTGGSRAASPRTMVDFAVPFSPRTRTPPMAGDTALSSSASFRSAIPTMPANGYALSAGLALPVVAIQLVLPGFPRPKWSAQRQPESLASGSRPRRSPPVTVAGQPRPHTGVPPRCYLRTAWHTAPGRRGVVRAGPALTAGYTGPGSP